MRYLTSFKSARNVAAFIASLVLIAGCTQSQSMPDPPAPPSPPIPHVAALSDDAVRKIAADPNVKTVVTANNDFGFRLLGKLDQDQAGKNTFFSPLSVSSALMMTWNGAAGQTDEEMAQTLGISSAVSSAIDQGYSVLLPYLRNPDDKVELSIANALWIRRDLHFAPAFQQACEKNFGAQTTSLDLGSQSGIDAINSWVNQNTHGKIPTIIDSPPDPSIVAVLTDAIYFHGTWSDPFDKINTHPGPFTPERDPTKQVPLLLRVQVPFMYQESDFPYLETPQFQAIALPYSSGRISMYVILPKAGTSTSDLVTGLTSQTWDQLMGEFSNKDVRLFLPKFHADYKASLADTLKSLGMVAAFDPNRADFTPMGFKGAYISYVLHKATLDVDEEGTVAAATTAVGVGAMAMPVHPVSIVMRVDHPFFCAIRDNATGIILFEGIIRDPGAVTTPTSASP
jgi:serpin B